MKKTAATLHELFTTAAKQFGFEPGEIISVCPKQEKMSGKWLEDDESILQEVSNDTYWKRDLL